MIAENLTKVRDQIKDAALRAGRDPNDITLVGVTKQQTVETMLEGYGAGLRHFGENRVEEMTAKLPAFLQRIDPADPPTIHMIGHLQRRKVADALQYSHMIHSVDTVRLAERINRLAECQVTVLLECNISAEENKAGFPAANWEEDPTTLERFREAVGAIIQLPKVAVAGLMTMAPFVADVEETRPYFRSLRRLMSVCREIFPTAPWRHLSMGMTNDFDVAIEEGATMVRVGRAIFPRD
jgi:hypothetical protein